MGKRLFVGNLGFKVTSEELQGLFEPFGEVRSALILTDRDTGQSRGFGFVEMLNDADADAAIENIDGNEFLGRRLNVNEAKPRTPGGGGRDDQRGGGGGGGGGGDGGGRGGFGNGY